MKTFVASSPNVEVNGETIFSVIDGMGAYSGSAIKILSENGINNPVSGTWFSQQSWLNSFKQIAEKVGNITLFNIGLKIPKNAKFPPEVNDIHKALAAIDVAYHMNHRGGEIGFYKYEKLGENSGMVVCDNPYPDEFDRGIITAMCRKFVTNIMQIKVIIDESKPVRSKGGESTTYIVNW